MPENKTPSLKSISKDKPFEVKGMNGQISFNGKSVIISRKGLLGFMTQGLKGQKEIPVKSIVSIQMKKGGPLVNGYIQFATGAGESVGGITAAQKDENSVLFIIHDNDDFEILRDLVNEAMNTPAETGSSASVAEQLEKLAGLLERGLLTEKEFLAEKKKLLG